MTVAVLIPSYHRPERLTQALASLEENTAGEYTPYVIVEPDDTETFEAALDSDAVVFVNEGRPCYAGAINTAYHNTTEPYLFAGADDLAFHPRWLSIALEQMVPPIQVVGTNDLLNPFVAQGTHATHYLVRRGYLDVRGGLKGEPGSFMLEELSHQYTDTLFIDLARAREVFAPCLESVVEHLHFLNGKAPKDETYDRAYRDIEADEETYRNKIAEWGIVGNG